MTEKELKFLVKVKKLFLLDSFQTDSGAHPASFPMVAGRADSPGIKGPASEADHLPRYTVEFKISGTIPSLLIGLQGVVLT
jgi:hypothetical protein